MGADADSLNSFKKSALTHLFVSDANPPRSLFLVCAKFGGEICFFASNDVKMKSVLPQLRPIGGDYYVWAVFEDNAEARSYYEKVRAIDVSSYIPRDPKQVKAER